MSMYVVIVGTDANTAQPESREFAGKAVHGIFSTPQAARDFANEVEQEWMKQLKEHGPAAFPYGSPYVEVQPIDERSDPRDWFGYVSRAAKAARNWYREMA